MSKLMDKFLMKLKIPEEKSSGRAVAEQSSGGSDGGRPWFRGGRNEQNEVVADGFRVVDTGLRPVEKNDNGGRKVVFNRDNRWKSTRDREEYRHVPWYLTALVGIAVVVAFYSTYIEAYVDLQVSAYAFALAAVIAVDPLKMVSRWLAKNTRGLVSATILTMIMCRILDEERYWTIGLIASGVMILVSFVMNGLWVKDENWLYSTEADHALHGDPDNKALMWWRADGRRKTRTALGHTGITVTDEDLDTVIKVSSMMGFWGCYEYQKDQSKRIEALRIENLAIKATREREISGAQYEADEYKQKYDALIDEFNALVDDYDTLAEAYDVLKEESKGVIVRGLADQRHYVEEDLPEEVIQDEEEEELFEDEYLDYEDEEEISAEQDPVHEDLPELPEGITPEAYYEVIGLLDDGKGERTIANLTGVSRYRIRQIKAIMAQNSESSSAAGDNVVMFDRAVNG